MEANKLIQLASSADPSPEAQTRVEWLHRDVREELTRADAKATTLLGLGGVLLGVALAGFSAGDWSPHDLPAPTEWLFWIGFAAVLIRQFYFLLAVMPRVSHDRPFQEIRYFGHIAPLASREDLYIALAQVDMPYHHMVDQVWVLSRITDRKFFLIRRGLQVFSVGIVLAGIALLALSFAGGTGSSSNDRPVPHSRLLSRSL